MNGFRKSLFSALLFLAAAILPGAQRANAEPAVTTAPASPPALRADETVLYQIPSGVKVADMITSPDARHVACVEQRAAGEERTFDVSLDGAAGPRVQWIIGQSLLFSPDAGRLSWQTQDSLTSVIVDSVEHLLHDGSSDRAAPGTTGDPSPAVTGSGYWMAGHVLFSRDGRHAAWPAQLDKTDTPPWRMVVDGKPGDSFDALDDALMLFSPDGGRLAYKAIRAGRQLFVVDDSPGPGYDVVTAPVFSDNGARFAYVAKRGAEEFYIIDGKEGPHFDMTAALSFNAGGRRCAYVAGRADKQMLVVDGKSYKPFDGIGGLLFSPDGRRIAMTAMNGPRWTIVIDGKECGDFDGAGAPHFSPDSRRLAFIAGRGKQQFLVADGKEGPPFDGIGLVSFSADSTKIAYVAGDGPSRVLVVDGQRIGPASAYAFSPDSRHIARSLQRPDGNWALAIDGTEADAVYDGFPLGSRIVWESPDTVRTIAGRGNAMFRVELHLP
jgi:hypothetical protein